MVLRRRNRLSGGVRTGLAGQRLELTARSRNGCIPPWRDRHAAGASVFLALWLGARADGSGAAMTAHRIEIGTLSPEIPGNSGGVWIA